MCATICLLGRSPAPPVPPHLFLLPHVSVVLPSANGAASDPEDGGEAALRAALDAIAATRLRMEPLEGLLLQV